MCESRESQDKSVHSCQYHVSVNMYLNKEVCVKLHQYVSLSVGRKIKGGKGAPQRDEAMLHTCTSALFERLPHVGRMRVGGGTCPFFICYTFFNLCEPPLAFCSSKKIKVEREKRQNFTLPFLLMLFLWPTRVVGRARRRHPQTAPRRQRRPRAAAP